MKLTLKKILFIFCSTITWLLVMLAGSAELISWSVWAQNLTAGMSAVAVKIFSNAAEARLILCVLAGLIVLPLSVKVFSKKNLTFYLIAIVTLILFIDFLGRNNIKEFHLFEALFFITLQIPFYINLFSPSTLFFHTIVKTKGLLNISFKWMLIVIALGMLSFYAYFQHPQQLLSVNFQKYGLASEAYPYLLHFSVLGNFIFLSISIFFLISIISSFIKRSQVKVFAECTLFLVFISFIVKAIFSELYHEIEITESRYILDLMPLFIPIIFSPLLLAIIIRVNDYAKSILNTPFLIMYIVGILPAKLILFFLPEKVRSTINWKFILPILLLIYFSITIYIFRGFIFDPWYTILSPIKGLLYAMVLWISSTILLVPLLKISQKPTLAPFSQISFIFLIFISSLIIPIKFHQNPGLKGLLVQYSESVKISLDGMRASYPDFISSEILKVGQDAKVNTTYSIHPDPIDFRHKESGFLNDSTSYIYIMADAMRGDFYEGRFKKYDSLYPFMKTWIKEECVWFPHAYSQSNGSYIGIPALFGSHGNRSILKPTAKNENRFFQMLKKEGFEDIYSIDGNSLNNLFPDDIKVKSLGKVPEDFGSYDRNVRAMELLDKLKLAFLNRSNVKPFFAYLLLMDTHNDYEIKEGIRNYGNQPVDLYAHNIRYVDYFMKELTEWLKDINEYENTVIVLTSDHGEEFKEHESTLHGHNFFEEVMRVPVIMKLPNVPAKKIETPILNSDIFPTLATMRGYDLSNEYKYEHLGIDLSNKILQQDETEERDMLFISSQNTKHALFRNGRYKLIYWPKYESYVFYDLLKDAKEYDNLIEENHVDAREMHKKMMKLINETSGEFYTNSWPSNFQ